MGKIKYLNSAPCVEQIDHITSRVFVRLSHEYGIFVIKRELIPTLGSIVIKKIITELSSLRKNDELGAYINIFDIVTIGLVELNFEETEKATNILPDFRIGNYGCRLMDIDYAKYDKTQANLNKFKSTVLRLDFDNNSTFSKGLYKSIADVVYNLTNFVLNDFEFGSIRIFIKLFLEEVFREIKLNKKNKEFSFKLFDILYFEVVGNNMISLDSLPEYKLMVKNDARLEDTVYEAIEEEEEKDRNTTKSSLYY